MNVAELLHLGKRERPVQRREDSPMVREIADIAIGMVLKYSPDSSGLKGLAQLGTPLPILIENEMWQLDVQKDTVDQQNLYRIRLHTTNLKTNEELALAIFTDQNIESIVGVAFQSGRHQLAPIRIEPRNFETEYAMTKNKAKPVKL